MGVVVHVNQEFSSIMHSGSVIIDITSMAAYSMPEMALPKKAYPRSLATGMGKLEKEHGGSMLETSALKWMGTPEGLGYAIATPADERNGYLCGVDILCEGGTIRGQKEFCKKK